MFDIYKYDRRLLDDYMKICNDLETALQSFDTLHSDIYAAFEALQEEAEDIEERINICSMRLGNASRATAAGAWGKMRSMSLVLMPAVIPTGYLWMMICRLSSSGIH